MNVWDELRFGSERTLNLREEQPSAVAAVRRADAWLRQQQIRGAAEVLIVTGRGSHSFEGVAVIRPAIAKLLATLRRQGVVAAHREHNPGAFAVELAPIKAMLEAPNSKRAPRPQPPHVTINGLEKATNDALRQLAETSLEALGVEVSEERLNDEMHRHLRALMPGVGSGPQAEVRLRAAIAKAVAEYD